MVVLILDEDEAGGRATAKLLARHQVIVTTSAHDAMTHLDRDPIDAIVAEYHVGSDVLAQMANRYGHIRRVIYTDSPESFEASSVARFVAQAVVVKPATAAQLEAALADPNRP